MFLLAEPGAPLFKKKTKTTTLTSLWLACVPCATKKLDGHSKSNLNETCRELLVRPVKWNTVCTVMLKQQSQSSCYHCIHVRAASQLCVSLCFSSKRSRSSGGGGQRTTLPLTEMMHSIFQRDFCVIMDWHKIYLTIFKGEAMMSTLLQHVTIFPNGWGDTKWRVGVHTLAWSEALTDPSRR